MFLWKTREREREREREIEREKERKREREKKTEKRQKRDRKDRKDRDKQRQTQRKREENQEAAAPLMSTKEAAEPTSCIARRLRKHSTTEHCSVYESSCKSAMQKMHFPRWCAPPRMKRRRTSSMSS